MELERFTSIKVKLYNTEETFVQVSCKIQNGLAIVSHICKRLFDDLGIGDQHTKYFVLVETDKGVPIKKLKSTDEVNIHSSDLYVHKWIFDADVENSLLEEEAIVHLLHKTCKYDISHGKLQPSHTQVSKLEDYEDPNFLVAMQYVKLCQGLPNYESVIFENCCLISGFATPNNLLIEGDIVKMFVSSNGLFLHKGHQGYHVFWTKIQSWTSNYKSKTAEFAICMTSGATKYLNLETKQINFLHSVVSEIININMKKQGDGFGFLTSMFQRKNSEEISVDNPLYAPVTRDNPMFDAMALDDPDYIPGTSDSNPSGVQNTVDLSTL